MISNFIISFLIMIVIILLATWFITLGENINWVIVRYVIVTFGFIGAVVTTLVCEAIETNLLKEIKKK